MLFQQVTCHKHTHTLPFFSVSIQALLAFASSSVSCPGSRNDTELRVGDRGHIILLINPVLINCSSSNVDAVMALKLEYVRVLQNISRIPPS